MINENDLHNWFCNLSYNDKIFVHQAEWQVKKLKQECHQWKETCEILADPKLMKSITQSLKEFVEGKGIKLNDLLVEEKAPR